VIRDDQPTDHGSTPAEEGLLENLIAVTSSLLSFVLGPSKAAFETSSPVPRTTHFGRGTRDRTSSGGPKGRNRKVRVTFRAQKVASISEPGLSCRIPTFVCHELVPSHERRRAVRLCQFRLACVIVSSMLEELDAPMATEAVLLPLTPTRSKSRTIFGAAFLLMLGPGLMVMLADTDAGSVVTAAQSGARFRYAFIVPELLLIPVLYVVQEMTVRLGLVTRQGHGALIRATFGSRWALVSAGTLFVACAGALVTEFAGIAGVGELVGIPKWISIGAAVTALVALLLLGRYRRIEHVGIAVGALELLFLPAVFFSHPHLGAIFQAAADPIRTNSSYLTLLAANVGCVIMPWMIFYQQEAVIDKGAHGLALPEAVRSSRLDTVVGSVLTQVVMVAVIIATGATIGVVSRGAALNSVGEIANALTPVLGRDRALVFFGLGLIGAALLAALVVTLAGAWGVSEVLGWCHSLNDSPARAARFYGLAVAGVALGGVLVIVAPNLVNLSVDAEVMNACLLPIVLGFLLLLERRALPAELRMHGVRRLATYALTAVVIVFGVVTIVTILANRF
jgi:Mn2+/Fe2+ NRAMP family transporter